MSHHLDPKWKYHGAASHANGAAFRRRMAARRRAAAVSALATGPKLVLYVDEVTKLPTKVTVIRGKK